MKTTRILIVDDQLFFSEMLKRTLSAESGIEVVETAQDGETAIRLAREIQPDAVLMDIELLGEMDGIDAGIQIKKERPETGIVILSLHNNRRYITRLPLDEIPGWSYLLKQTLPDLATLVRAIEGSIQGMLVLDPAVISGLRPRQDSELTRLTPRELEVLEHIAQGYNNASISRRMVLTERSVETYIHSVYQKLNISGEQDFHARVRATLKYLQNTQSSSGNH